MATACHDVAETLHREMRTQQKAYDCPPELHDDVCRIVATENTTAAENVVRPCVTHNHEA